MSASLEQEEARAAALGVDATGTPRKHLTDAMLDGFSLLDPAGVHIDVNPAFCAMTGFSRDELIGVGPPHAYWPPEEYDAIEAAFARTLAGENRTFPLTFMRKNGERFSALVSPAVIRDAVGGIVSAFATIKDMGDLTPAEASLAEGEQLFRLTFEQAPIGIALVGRDFRFQRVNERFAEMTGYTAEELLERGFPDITHPEDVAQDVAEVRRLAAGEIEEYAREKRYVRKDGSIAWGDVVVRPVLGGDGRTLAFVAMIADITARRHADEELAGLLAATHEEKDRLSALLASIPDEIWFADTDGRFTMANPAAEREFNVVSADEKPVRELAAELEVLRADGTPRPIDEAPPLRALAGETVRNLEEMIRTPSGGELRTRLVNATPILGDDGAIIGSVSVVRDITDLRRAEESLGRERERAQTYLDIAGVMLVAIAADQTVLFANRKTCEVLELDEAEIVGANWFDTTVPEAERESIREGFAQLMADNIAPWEYVENSVVTGSGGERLIAWRNTVLKDDDGAVIATLSSGEDITSRRQAEAEIRRLNAELRQRVVSRTEQLDAATRELEALAYAIAHDVRAPLRSIDGFSALLVEDERERLSPQGVDELRRVRLAAQTLARLLDELMGLSNVSRRKLVRQIVDLSALAREVGEETAAAEPSRAVELTVQPGLVAEADPALLRLILRELLGNAWKFTAPQKAAHVEVGVQDDGERAFFVRDDGVGFDMARAEHLFGIFQRLPTAEGFEGDGVGLATVQRLVRRHGGRVWAEAESGKGATFFFTLPAAAAE